MLIDNLGMAFQSDDTTGSLIGNFYNHSQKLREMEDTFNDELQVLVCHIVAQKAEFMRK